MIESDPELASQVRAHGRLARQQDALYVLTPKLVLILAVPCIIAAGVALAAGEKVILFALTVIFGLLLFAAQTLLKDRDESRALVKDAAPLIGFVDDEHQLNARGRAVSDELDALLKNLDEDALPLVALRAAAKTQAAQLKAASQQQQLGPGKKPRP